LAPAPKGNAKIETTFSIDANGILHVTAVDKGTGRSQSVTIQNSGRVSDAEVDRMVKEAEKFKEEDAKRQKL
jgi:molecular chaperone DnaK (HSP70)